MQLIIEMWSFHTVSSIPGNVNIILPFASSSGIGIFYLNFRFEKWCFKEEEKLAGAGREFSKKFDFGIFLFVFFLPFYS